MKSPSRAFVLASAVEQIEGLESDSAKAKNFVGALQAQIKGLQDPARDSVFAIQRHLQVDDRLGR
jgi:hypothetical protein